MPTPSKTFGFMRGNILVLSISGALGMFCRSMVFPYAPLFILSLGGSPAEIGIVYALGPLGGLVVYPIAGYLADRVSRAKLIAFTGYFSSLTFLIYLFAPSWHWLAAARLLQGFAVLQHPASSALIADSLSPNSRGRGIATMTTFSGALAILAPYAAGLMLEWQGIDTGMRILYATMAIAYALGATINLVFIRETAQPRAEKISLVQLSASLRQTYTGLPSFLSKFPRTLKALTAIIILGFMANGVAGPFWVVYASDQIGLSSSQWGLVLLIEAGLGHLVRIPAGFLADRYGRARFILVSMALCTATIPLFVFAQTLTHVIAIRCIVAITMAFFGPACGALLADSVPRDIRGRVMAAIGRGSVRIGAATGGTGGPGVGFLTIIPLALASLAGGFFYEWHTASPWGFFLVATALALALGILFVRDSKNAEI
jgi:MFS family permease